MVSTESGIVTVVKEPHNEKAPEPIFLIVEGSVSEVKL